MSDIDALIEQAKKNAGAAVEPTANALTTSDPGKTEVANYNQPGPAMTLEDIAAGSLDVDAFLKITYPGISVGDDTAMFDTIKVKIRPSEVVPHKAVRWTVGNNTSYRKSYDGQREAKTGAPWKAIVAEAMRLDPKCTGDYDSADVPFTLLEPLKLKKGEVLEAGKRLGYTTSITGMKPFRAFTKEVLLKHDRDADLIGTLVHEPRTKDGNRWGVLSFGEAKSWVSADDMADAA